MPWYIKSLWDMSLYTTLFVGKYSYFCFPLGKQRNNKDKNLYPEVGAFLYSVNFLVAYIIPYCFSVITKSTATFYRSLL